MKGGQSDELFLAYTDSCEDWKILSISKRSMQTITMPTSIFQEIDSLHSQCAGMVKASKLGWLAGKRKRLYQLIDQLAMLVRVAGGFMNDSERTFAHDLLAMIQEVEAGGKGGRRNDKMTINYILN